LVICWQVIEKRQEVGLVWLAWFVAVGIAVKKQRLNGSFFTGGVSELR